MGKGIAKITDYTRILISHFLVVTAGIFISSAFLAFSFQDILTVSIEAFQKDSLSKTSYVMDSVYESVKTFTLQLYFDKDISKLRNFENPDYIETNNAFNRMSLYSAILPYIESVYVYSAASERMFIANPYGATRMYEADDFFDREILASLANISAERSLFPKKRTFPKITASGESSPVEGFTFMFFDQYSGTVPHEGAVVVNISENWIRNLVERYDTRYAGDMVIIDGAGRAVLHSGAEMEGDDRILRYSERVSGISEPFGSFFSGEGKEKELVVFARYEPFDWTFLRIVPFSEILVDIGRMRSRVLRLSSLILAAGLLISFFIARRVYRPIGALVSRLILLEDEVAEARLRRKHALLRALMMSDALAGDPDTAEELASFGLSTDLRRRWNLVLFSVDRYASLRASWTVSELAAWKTAAMERIRENSCGFAFSEALELDDDHFVLVIAGDPGLPDFEKSIEEAVRGVQASFGSGAGPSLSAVVGESFAGIETISSAYGELKRVSLDLFFHPRNSILEVRADGRKVNADFQYPVAQEKRICDALLSGNTEDAKAAYLELSRYAAQFSYYTYKYAVIHLAASISSVLIRLPQAEKATGGIYAFESFVHELDQGGSLEDVNDFFVGLFDSLGPLRAEAKESRKRELIGEVEQILKKEYGDRNLCLDTIAERFGMSPAYFGRLFLRLTGSSIVDAINETRMAAAAVLLAEGRMTIHEIIEATGYTNSQHFYRVFKKCFGLTPKEYARDRRRKAKLGEGL